MSGVVRTVDRTVDVQAGAPVVWDYVTDWSRHGEWIPLTRVETVGGPAREVGGRLRAWSGLGPVGFWDPLTVTAWQEAADGGGTCSLVHTGRVVRGDAVITVSSLGDGRSRLRWVEHFELGRLGALAWGLGGWTLDRGLGRALRTMARLVERR